MAETSSNHDNIIATNGTDHIARADPATDVCWVVKGVKQYNADNEQASKKLKTGMTTKSWIDKKNVWIQGSVLDLADSLKPHPGVQGGTKSGTYLKYAHATSWSKDLKMEGGGVVRSYDRTEQNGPTGGPYNCNGFVDPSAIKGAVSAADAAQRNRCMILNIDGECRDKMKGAPPVPGMPSAPALARKISTNKHQVILEVVGEDIITLRADRLNMSLPAKNPPAGPCPNEHTLWIRTISGQGKVDQVIFRGKDEYKFVVHDPYKPAGLSTDGNVTFIRGNEGMKAGADPEALKVQGAGLEKGEAEVGITDKYKKVQQDWIRNAETKNYNKTIQPSIAPDAPQKRDLTTITYKETDSPTPRADGTRLEPGRTNQSSTTDSKGVANTASENNWRTARAVANNAVQDYLAFRKFWSMHSDPPTQVIVAQACGGAQQVTLHVYPAGSYSFNLFTEAINSKLQIIKDVSKIVTQFSNTFGWKFYLNFLERPNVTIDVAYKELGADRADRGRWHWQVWPSAMLQFSFGPLLKCGFKGTCSLLIFAGVIGKAAAWILEKAGIEGNFFGEASISFSPSISAGFNEYDDLTASASFTTFIVEFKAGLEAFGGKGRITAQATIYGYMTTTLAITNPRVSAQNFLEVALTGQIQLGVKGSASASIFYWNAEKSFDYSPEWLRFPPLGAKDLAVLPLIPGPRH